MFSIKPEEFSFRFIVHSRFSFPVDRRRLASVSSAELFRSFPSLFARGPCQCRRSSSIDRSHFSCLSRRNILSWTDRSLLPPSLSLIRPSSSLIELNFSQFLQTCANLDQRPLGIFPRTWLRTFPRFGSFHRLRRLRLRAKSERAMISSGLI